MKRFLAIAVILTLVFVMAVTAFAQHERPPEVTGVAEPLAYGDTFRGEIVPQPDGE